MSCPTQSRKPVSISPCCVVATDRLRVVQMVEELDAVLGRYMAVDDVARQEKIGVRTIWNWLAMVDVVNIANRLPYLAPRHRAAAPKRKKAECSPEFLDWLKADFLRLGEQFERSVALP